MTIAFVSDAIYPYNKGGKEKRLYELSTRLAAMGHDVHIYCMKWWDGPDRDRTEHGVQLHAICKLYPMYKGERRSIKQGIMFGLACLRLWRVRFDVIDVDHMPFFPIFGTWAVARLRGRKMHGTWHEVLECREWTDYMGWGGYVANLIQHLSVRLPHTITTSSNHAFPLITSQLRRRKRIHVVTPGIDVEAIQEIPAAPVRSDILFVGRLVKDKNAAMLVRAVAILAKQRPDIQCHIIGEGIEKSNIARLIKQLKLERNVHLLGNLPHHREVYAYMKAARVFALPSNREGFGIVVLEALACHTPVVTLNKVANASRLLIKEGQTGSAVEATPAALAAGIAHWLEQEVAAGVLQQFVQQYDWQELARKQAGVYAG